MPSAALLSLSRRSPGQLSCILVPTSPSMPEELEQLEQALGAARVAPAPPQTLGLEGADGREGATVAASSPVSAIGQSKESDAPSGGGSLAKARHFYALEAIRRVKERREYEAAREKRKKAESAARAYGARKTVLASLKDSDLKDRALARGAPATSLPELPTRPSRTSSRTWTAWLPSPELDLLAAGQDRVRKIDFHQHCMPDDEEGLMALLEANRAWGVEKSVLLSLRLPRSSRRDVKARNDWVLDVASRQDLPCEVIPFVTIIEDDPQAAKMFEECLERGARGLKLIGWHSAYIKQFDYDLRLPSLMEVFRLAASWKVPVLMHLWVGYGKTKRDYIADLEAICTELPTLRLVLAHFGLGFDPETLPGLVSLVARHRHIYFDTSLYGSFCELWFSRASNQAERLREVVQRFPKQVLFGSDVFGSRMKAKLEYSQALRASIAFVNEESLACAEFKCTDYFTSQTKDKYGPVSFHPLQLTGLGLGKDKELISRIFYDNAKELLNRNA
eukprot:gnl/TRDRNA2_/TRDRNA2_169645_c0_seq1.p1 gnl/TRDRNA2_/TRDRNA2_169645_c0~~gnl/TRDRNA2_/TRDRNA2_169645_c0_seq1.p1  ORF type:complete len:506 (-),score=98.60 gnl/TRDRNA2_/TRDRNA2_169645_c0_seq1:229-1746(-)